MSHANGGRGAKPLGLIMKKTENEEHTYLWDGSGEPDPEIVRLETLLGQLRHRGVPPALPARKPSRLRVTPMIAALSAAAAILLIALQQLAIRNVEGLALLQEYDKIVILIASVLGLGIAIGIASTYQSLARYLRMALDDLY